MKDLVLEYLTNHRYIAHIELWREFKGRCSFDDLFSLIDQFTQEGLIALDRCSEFEMRGDRSYEFPFLDFVSYENNFNIRFIERSSQDLCDAHHNLN